MKRLILESAGLLSLSALIAVTTYLIVGAPDRSVPCVQTDLEGDQVCLETVLKQWGGEVLWVDARSQAEFKKGRMAGALLITETDADNMIALPDNMEAIGMSGVQGKKLVVYCGTDACGGSKLVAKKIRDTGFHSEVFVLYGGWKAVLAGKVDFVSQ